MSAILLAQTSWPDRVRVYRNLRRAIWSLLDPRTGLVTGPQEALVLLDVRLIVSEATRQRVIRQNRRTVHAYAEGRGSDEPVRVGGEKLHYNPFQAGHFTAAGAVIAGAARVDFRREGAFVYA